MERPQVQTNCVHKTPQSFQVHTQAQVCRLHYPTSAQPWDSKVLRQENSVTLCSAPGDRGWCSGHASAKRSLAVLLEFGARRRPEIRGEGMARAWAGWRAEMAQNGQLGRVFSPRQRAHRPARQEGAEGQEPQELHGGLPALTLKSRKPQGGRRAQWGF